MSEFKKVVDVLQAAIRIELNGVDKIEKEIILFL